MDYLIDQIRDRMGTPILERRRPGEICDALAAITCHAHVQTRERPSRRHAHQQRVVAGVFDDEKCGITHEPVDVGTLLDIHVVVVCLGGVPKMRRPASQRYSRVAKGSFRMRTRPTPP